MYANYHTHTWRCGHATGTEREYVENAIRGGLKILGFSDHTPQLYDGDYYPERQKMRPEQLEDYVDTVLALKKEYEREIEIHLGLEVEYYPKYFERLLRFTEPYPIEYMLLGQHALGNGEPGDLFAFLPTDVPEDLLNYIAQCLEALETGRFLYFAHPDVLRFTGDPAFYQREMRRLCVKAKELRIPLEINLLGLGDHRNYPNPLFWEVAAEVGNRVVLGCDAHRPENVYRPEVISQAEEMAAGLNLTVLESLPLS
ncbi:MAG: histidinol-phosphatase [Lachnospiraceae bacterium]|nr:histidinol-phosphatase [Lachnospiraceae bacterium]